MVDVEAFQTDMGALGFRLTQDRGMGSIAFVREASPYLTYHVQMRTEESSLLFTWELAIGEFMDANGLQIGANEHLNQFLFPKHDARGPIDIAFVASEMDRVEQILGSINLLGD